MMTGSLQQAAAPNGVSTFVTLFHLRQYDTYMYDIQTDTTNFISRRKACCNCGTFASYKTHLQQSWRIGGKHVTLAWNVRHFARESRPAAGNGPWPTKVQIICCQNWPFDYTAPCHAAATEKGKISTHPHLLTRTLQGGFSSSQIFLDRYKKMADIDAKLPAPYPISVCRI